MQVSALFRHPIKSHGREQIDAVTLTQGQTMPWDRHWAVTHEATKFDLADPKWEKCRNFMLGSRTPGLAGIWATLDEDAARVTLTHQDLEDITFCPDDPADEARFLKWVAPLCPTNRSAPQGIVSAPGRGMTDSRMPSISIMTQASHDAVASAMGHDLELERWRGNIWLSGAIAWDELSWMDRSLQIGEAVLTVRQPCLRCSLTNTSPTTGIRDLDTLGVLNGTFGHQHFGVYAEVTTGGAVRTGDEATLI